MPWVLLGVLIVAGGALGFGVWGRSLGDRVEVLAAAADLAPGEVVTDTSFRVVEISGGSGGRFATPEMVAELTGQVAVGQVPAGTLINRSMFSATEPLADGRSILAAVLSPGEYPSPRLLIGTTVVALRSADDTPGLGEEETGWPITIAEVVNVDTLEAGTEPGGLLVGLDVPTDAAVEVADAAAADRLRLVVVPAESAEQSIGEMRAAAELVRATTQSGSDAGPTAADLDPANTDGTDGEGG